MLVGIGYHTGSTEPFIASALQEEVAAAWSPVALEHRRKKAQWRRTHPQGVHAPVSGLTAGTTAGFHRRSLSLSRAHGFFSREK
jgi:hypothetical protein